MTGTEVSLRYYYIESCFVLLFHSSPNSSFLCSLMSPRFRNADGLIQGNLGKISLSESVKILFNLYIRRRDPILLLVAVILGNKETNIYLVLNDQIEGLSADSPQCCTLDNKNDKI